MNRSARFILYRLHAIRSQIAHVSILSDFLSKYMCLYLSNRNNAKKGYLKPCRISLQLVCMSCIMRIAYISILSVVYTIMIVYTLFILKSLRTLKNRLFKSFINSYDHFINSYERQKRRCYHLLFIILLPLKLNKQISSQPIKHKTNLINHQISHNGKKHKYINNLNINRPPRYG